MPSTPDTNIVSPMKFTEMASRAAASVVPYVTFDEIALRQLVGERLVEVDDVDREPAQVAQGRVAGAEVVECDAQAEVAQPLQATDARLALPDEERLGDLDDEVGGIEPRRRQPVV